MEFTELNLNENLMAGIKDAGYVTCTPVQEQVLKGALDGSDLYVQSQTGTGKTAAYLISIIQELLTRKEVAEKKALIMVPTRELAVQVENEAKTLAKATGLKTCSFYGGVGYDRQKDMLKKGVDILVGTPGRVIDLHESGDMILSEVSFLVIDEADRMFDMGFYPDLRTLIKVLSKPEDRQTMLFSATLNTYVKNLAWEYTTEAKEITIESEQITVDEIDQVLLHVSSDKKMNLLLGILSNEKPDSIIVFCNTKHSCEVIAKRLQLNGIESEFIIGDLPQSKRLQVLESFKRGSLKCLVATDVAARGIDVNDLSMVVNFDLPNEAENYVHRIGRTARAGKTGKAYTFCSEQDVYNLPAIERYLESPIPASMPTEEMFISDKSEGVYIRTNRYDDEEHSRDKTRSSQHNRNDHDKRQRRSYDNNRNSKRASKPQDDNAINPKTINAVALAAGNMNAKPDNLSYIEKDLKHNFRSNRPNRSNSNRNFKKTDYQKNTSYRGKNKFATEQSSKNNIDMSKLSFEERMKLYKEKYANPTSKSSDNQRSRSNDDRRNSNRYSNKKGSHNKSTKYSDKQSYAKKSSSTNTESRKNNNNEQKQVGFFNRLKSIFGRGK